MYEQYWEADEPTCVNCNEVESDHCDNCETCVPGSEQMLSDGDWVCEACYLE